MFSSDIQLWHMLVMVFLGIGAAFINSVAGGGSILSLPFMIFTGIPTVMAHGTNRFGLIFGALGSFLDLKKRGQVNVSLIATMLLPVGLGSFMGALLAVRMSANFFNLLLAIVIILVALNIGKREPSDPTMPPGNFPKKFNTALLLFVGFYGGFIQVGTGLVMMYAFSRKCHLSLIQVNALKAAMASLILIVSLVVFSSMGMIHWPLALCFALGSYAGGRLGAWWQLAKGISAVIWVVKIMGCVMALKLIWQFF